MSPLTRSVPAGSHTDFIGPLPRIWIVPTTEPSAKIRPKAEHAAPVDLSQPVVTVPPPVVPTLESLASIGSGAKREDLSKLGDPAYKMSIPDDGHLVEVYRYQANGKDVGTVRLRDGVVTAVQVSQP